MRSWLLTFLLLFPVLSISQEHNWKFNRLSLEDGLSNTYVTQILKDSKGYMWYATSNGLNRYNAYEMEVFAHDAEDENSLRSPNIRSIIEDKKGNIWVGTRLGLSKYNRKDGSFKKFVQDTTKEVSAPQSVYHLVEDHDGNIWIGTAQTNVIKFDPVNEIFDSPLEETDSIPFQSIRKMIVDHNNVLWVGYNGSGVAKHDIKSSKTKYYHPLEDPRCTIDLAYTFTVFEDRDHDIWIGTFTGGLAKYDPSIDNFKFFENPYHSGNVTKQGVQALGQDEDGKILAGANGGGLYIFNPKTEKFEHNYTFNALNENSISDDFIIEIFKDDNGIIWFGTENGGVFYYNPYENRFKSYKKEGSSSTDLPGVIINTIYAKNDKEIWIGTENNGYAKLNRETGEYEQFRLPNAHADQGNTFINTIVRDNNGGIWLGAEMGGIAHIGAENNFIQQYGMFVQGNIKGVLPHHDILTLLMAQDSTLWVGGFNSIMEKDGEGFVLHCPMKGDDRCLNPVFSLIEYNSDWLVAGYANDGIRFFNQKTKEYGSHFLADDDDPTSIPTNWVNCVYKDSKGRLWTGGTRGLSFFNLEDSTFITYTTTDGLSDNDVVGILEDGKGHLWLSTSYGLCDFDPESLHFKNYYQEDGLQSSVFRTGAAYKSKTGELFFGGPNGFNSFYPYDLQDNPHLPKVVFTDFKVFNKSVELGEGSPLKNLIEETTEIELDYSQDVFSFEFAALNFTSPEKNEYAYMLEGFDEDWNYIGKRRYITFTSIPPGDYILKIKASNNDGLWNEKPTTLKIIIHPPFWQTWWFRILVIASLIGLVYFIYKRRVRKIERQNKILEQQVAERTKQVVEQKNEIEHQKEIVEEKNRDMLDSIRYSKRIQDSFLPEVSVLKNKFENAFVLFKPKDIVSGDFYWAEELHGKFYVAVADCTGHGVPGAMVSVLGNNGLHRSIKDNQVKIPGEILDDLTDYVVQSLEKKGEVVRDGMDISLCSIDQTNLMMQYAGANNPVWIARNSEIIEYKADKQPIGKYAERKPFTTIDIQLEKGDWVFLFSDGFPDQFGGPKGKKFKYATLKQTLLDFEKSEEQDFENYLEIVFNNWKGELEQIDDVCVIGVRV